MAEDVTVERTINAPPDVLWRMVSDVTRMGEWSPETTGCDWIGDTKEPAAGARFKGRNQKGWRRWSTVCTVAAAIPGESFVFDVKSGPVDISRWAYRFEKTETGTRVTETWTDKRPGWMEKVTGVVMGVKDRAAHNRAGMEKTLEQLATAAESAPN
jgi:uncharacterized protein YndB with AHSA1/START domain